MTQVTASDALARMGAEFWKLLRTSERLLAHLPEKDRARHLAQLRYSDLQLQSLSGQMGLKLVAFEGQPMVPGLAASADNADDYPEDTPLVVTRTLSPAVIQDMTVILKGRVIVEPIPQNLIEV